MGGNFIVISFVVDEPIMTSPPADAFSNDGDIGDITEGEHDNLCTLHLCIEIHEGNHLQYELPVTANCKFLLNSFLSV